MIEITRNFIKKVQVNQYEPVSFSCSVKKEVDEKDLLKESERLSKICVEEVEKDIENYLNVPCKICGGLPSLKSGGIREKFVDGFCPECLKVKRIKEREFNE